MTVRVAQLVAIASLIGCLGTASWGVDNPLMPGSAGRITVRSDEEFSRLEALAEKAYGGGRYQEAIRLFSRALRKYPSCGELYFGRGMAYEMVNRPKAATRDYREALRLDSRNFRAMENLAGILERTGQSTEEAIKWYRTALSLDSRPEWQENLAVWIRMLESTLKADNESAVAAWHLGNSRARAGKLEAAMACYSKAIGLNSLFYQAYYSRALVRIRAGDPESALPDLNAAITMSPGLRGALVQRALVYERLENRRRAANDLRRAVRFDPGDAAGHYELGRMLQEDGHYVAAAESFLQALHLKPKPELKALIRSHIAALRGAVVKRDSDRTRIRRMLHELW